MTARDHIAAGRRFYLYAWILALCLGLPGCGHGSWHAEDDATVTAGPLLDNGHLFVTTSSHDLAFRLRSHDARTGREHWQVELAGWDSCPHLAVDELELIVGCGAVVHGFDATSGHLNWRRTMGGPLDRPVTMHHRLAALVAKLPSGELELTSVTTDTGQVTLREILPVGSQVTLLSGIIVAATETTLTAFEPATGKRRWEHQLPAAPLQLIGGASGLLAVTAQRLVGIDTQTGAEKWTRPTEGQVAPAVLEALICFAEGGLLVGVDAETGREKWQRRMAGVVTAPLLTHDVVYVHTAGGVLHALSSVDGEPLWKLPVGAPGRITALNEELYVWTTARELRVADLVRRELRKPIPLRSARLARDDDPATWPVQRPLLLSGSMLFGVDRGAGVFMHSLAP